jgi:hypothetical protein
MNEQIDPQWREELRNMSSKEKRAFLRAVMRLRIHCPTCPIKEPNLDREPCYSCINLPGDTGRPLSTVN